MSVASPLSFTGSAERALNFAGAHARWQPGWKPRTWYMTLWTLTFAFIAAAWCLIAAYYLMLVFIPLFWPFWLISRGFGRSRRREAAAQRRHDELMAAYYQR